jgi:uncharacterized protein (TIGR02271 family)
MRMTLIGWFEDLQTAQKAARELDAYGIDRQRVKVTAASAVHEDAGSGNASLLRWSGLRALLGRDQPPRGAEIALVADVEPGAADDAAQILERHGTLRVDLPKQAQAKQPQSAPTRPQSAARQPRSASRPPQAASEQPQSAAPATLAPAPEPRVRRVTPRPLERVVEQPVTIREQTVDVQRVPADRPATDDDLRAWAEFEEGGAIDGSTNAGRTIPVIEERLELDKARRDTARVRVRKSVETEDRTITETHVEQTYDIERVPVNRAVQEAPQPRYEGDTLVLPVLEEVLVTEKRLILREEVRIRRKRQERSAPATHTLLREQVQVDRTPPE